MNTRIRLSDDFWLYEFLKSETAARMGRTLEPDAAVIINLTRLCQTVLQPLRKDINKTMVISSGWRPDWLNIAVGGSKNSSHMGGCAADCNAVGMTPFELCTSAVALRLPFDQVILEFDSWMHISVPAIGEAPRSQILTAVKRDVNGDGKLRTVYLDGLVETPNE